MKEGGVLGVGGEREEIKGGKKRKKREGHISRDLNWKWCTWDTKRGAGAAGSDLTSSAFFSGDKICLKN